jgi:high-affinity iron transporter
MQHPLRTLTRRGLDLLLLCALALGVVAPAAAQTPSVASHTESIRTGLLAAQLDITAPAATSQLAAAQQSYTDSLQPALAAAAPAADQQIQDAFVTANDALVAGDAVAFAAARSQVWTGLLHGAYQVVRAAVETGDALTARSWLLVREFRQATRFSRPGVDATLAIAQLETGAADHAPLLQAIDADLLDVYQTRLREALAALAGADAQDHAVRRAELAGLAAGYFAILAPVYAEQQGAAAAAEVTDRFEAMVTVASGGQSVAALLPELTGALQHFQAAPLSPEAQSRRASQMLRFLALVPVEYGRGVRNGEVSVDLEIREAITFRDGAAAAFADLYAPLAALNPALATQTETQFATLGELLAATSTRQQVAEPGAIQNVTDALLSDLRQLLPAAWQKQDSNADFDMIQAALDQMERAVAAGDYAVAASAQLDAYAILESGPEARLIAFAPQYIPLLEDAFWYGQNEPKGLAWLLEHQASRQEISAARSALDARLAEAQDALGGESAPFAILVNAAIIVFREGLEAVVILAALLASMVGVRRVYRRPVAWGVAAAFVASALTWWLMQTVLSAFRGYGERLEAVVSLVAIAVLLLITNWFFHRVYWTDWMADLHDRKKTLLGSAAAGQLFGFVMLGFSSVYREGFETVLFLQALVLEAGAWTVIQGTALGMAGVLGVGWLTFKLQSRLPYKRMLVVTGVLIGAVLLVMVGNTVHVMQVVGWLPIHPVRWLTLPYWSGLWFGIYPTWEGFGFQAAAAAFVIGSYILAESMQKRSTAQAKARHTPAAERQPLTAAPKPE